MSRSQMTLRFWSLDWLLIITCYIWTHTWMLNLQSISLPVRFTSTKPVYISCGFFYFIFFYFGFTFVLIFSVVLPSPVWSCLLLILLPVFWILGLPAIFCTSACLWINTIDGFLPVRLACACVCLNPCVLRECLPKPGHNRITGEQLQVCHAYDIHTQVGVRCPSPLWRWFISL